MNPLNADQREQQLTRLLEAVSKERDAALAQLELERREKGELVDAVRAKCQEIRDTGKHCRLVDHKYNECCDCREITADVESVLPALTPQEAPDGQ
jgi:hypothetical protein